MYLHVVHTGGTIGAQLDSDGVIFEDRNPAGVLAKHLCELLPSDWEVSYSCPYSILSENLDLCHWNSLIKELRRLLMGKGSDAPATDAVFVMHGTDTLAYTSNLLALLCFGIDSPIFLISANKPIGEPGSNAHANIRAAISMLKNGCEPGVYVPYEDESGELVVHKGEKLLQYNAFSDGPVSVKDTAINDLGSLSSAILEKVGRSKPLLSEARLAANILTVSPVPGMRYDFYDLTNVDAVLHSTYHSFTASSLEGGLPALAENAARNGIAIYVAPILSGEKLYSSMVEILAHKNVRPLYDMTFEMAFIYLLVTIQK
jgi:L-asparaginase